MTVHKRKEIEIKVRLGDDFNALKAARTTVQQLGFTQNGIRLETDYLPDTNDDLCKRAGLLLRFRKEETTASVNWLLTLKWRTDTDGVMDFLEIETDFTNVDTDTFRHIQLVIMNATGHKLDQSLLESKSFAHLRTILQSSGFDKNRILLDKYREEYSKGQDNITLDFFPDGMGTYMEIESHTKRQLESIVKRAKIIPKDVIVTDYGDLLKEHKKHLPPTEQRVALFSSDERSTLLGV